jgi:hypothetical protein
MAWAVISKRNTLRAMLHEDSWQFNRDGGEKPNHVTWTKKEAEQISRTINQNQDDSLQIHGRGMKIQQSDSHVHGFNEKRWPNHAIEWKGIYRLNSNCHMMSR